jgi:hypothetical protein
MKTGMVRLLYGGGFFAALIGISANAAERPTLGARAHQQIQALHDEKAARSPALRKLDSQLVYALRQKRQPTIAPGVDSLRPALRFQPDGRSLVVDVRATVTPDLLASIARGGGAVINSFPRYRAIRASVPFELIEALAGRADVDHVGPADEATTNTGPINSEGDITHQAGAARSAFQVSGAGVRVGVLSDSVDYLSSSLDSGELASVRVLPGQAGFGSGEGTAMLEIVHDLAPDAELYFATAFNGVASFAQNIRDLYAAGCRVIVDDVTYFNESPFQDGPISQAVNEVAAGGALFFSSAGNSGNKNDNTSGTWEGDFLDGGPATVARGGRLHDFGGVTFNTLQPAGGFRRVDLFWADPLGASANDYDVYVLNPDDSVARSSTNVQDGDDDPYEAIPFLSPGQRIVIVKYSGADRYLHLSSGRGVLAVSTPGATRGHNASGASNAFGVAATWVGAPAVPFVGGNANPIELFSSDGPRKMFFNPDGSAILPGNFSSTGGVVLQKPDMTAADGVATSVPFFGSFFGTSASAPHAAAIAALLWSYHPGLSPAGIRATFAASAFDIEEPGIDRDSGIGIVMALESLNAAPPPLPRLLFESVSLTGGNGNGSIEANECGGLFITLRNLISSTGQTATGVTAVLTAITPGVLVDPTPQFFPAVAPGASAANLAPFRISIVAGYPCGTPAVFELLVTASNASGSRLSFQLPSTPPGVGFPLSFSAVDVPLTVPDLGTVESAVTVTGIALPVAKVTVELHVSHTYDSDLQISLIGPDETMVDLSSNNGGSGVDYGTSCAARTVFDDSASNAIASAVTPFVGMFRPEQSLAAFNGKTGAAVNGTWRLRIRDTADFDSGVLECWTVQVSPILCPGGDGQCLLPPNIVSHPQSLLATNGDTARFGVVAEGSAPLSFQWYFDSTNALTGATNADLVLSHVTPEQAGRYSVSISNPYGTVLSAEAELTVVVPPQIVLPPQDRIATNGFAAVFSVIAEGTSPLYFQWLFNETNPLVGATNATLSLDAVTPTQAGNYSIVVSNAYGVAISSPALLTVVVPPFITQQPQDQTVSDGGTAVFTVTAGGNQPLSFQWYYNETNLLGGGTNASLNLNNVTTNEAGGYSVVVANAYGVVTSAEAELTVLESNEPPSVVLTAPADGSVFLVSTSISLAATAADLDGAVANVRFMAGEAELGQAHIAPYRFEWLDPNIGPHDLRAVATDSEGASTTSAVVRVTVNLSTNATRLVSTGSVWKYLDTGVDQGTGWRTIAFNDSTWPSGPAELGYGDADEATVVSFGPNETNKFITTYFRRSFFLTDAASFMNLQLRLLRDDGAVVYLNAAEVFRSNMPTGAVVFSTRALSTVNGTAEGAFFTTNVPPHLLRSGTNVLAVEVHQVNPTSSDVSFAFELAGRRSFGPRIITSPQSQEVPDGSLVTLNVAAVGGEPLHFQWYFNATNVLTGATNATLVLQNVATNRSGLYSVVVSNAFGVANSTGAVLTVFPFNARPNISLVSPTNGALFELNGRPILMEAGTSDPDGSIMQVEFFADDAPLGTTTGAPFRFEWLDARVGLHTLSAVATDNEGTRATSAVAQITVSFSTNRARLISAGAVWRFLDNGTDQGEIWRKLGFDDHTWASGPAELGYGDAVEGRPEATVVSFGPNSTNKFVTTYFRRAFVLTDASSFSDLSVRLLRDDGAVIYLNDVEVFRSNVPTGSVGFATLATATVGGANETNYVTTPVNAALLRNGTNIVAVEIHQVNVTSSDISFDLELMANRFFAPTIVVQPGSQTVTTGANVTFAVTAVGAEPLSYRWFFNITNILTGASTSTFVLSNVTSNEAGTYSVVVSNAHGTVASALAQLRVIVPGSLPPTIALVRPGNEDRFDLGSPIRLEAAASDPDGMLRKVLFYANDAELGEDSTSPFEFDWLNASAGLHVLRAVAIDDFGASATSAVVRIAVTPAVNTAVTLIATGAVWNYLDTGVNQGVAWRASEFDDSAWASGPAELGYGDEVEGRPEATVIEFGLDSQRKFITYYFRHRFVVNNRDVVRQLEARLLQDDGAVVYLNGVEVFRNNMPTGEINSNTRATAAVSRDEEFQFFSESVDASLLVNGTNVVAVEVHQVNQTSSDISFDFALLGLRLNPPAILMSPQSQTVMEGETAAFTVLASGGGLLTYQWFFDETNALSGATNETLVLQNVSTIQAGNYFVAVSNSAGVTLSVAALLTVLAPPPNEPPVVTLISPTNGAMFLETAVIPLTAIAEDNDGQIIVVEFFDGPTKIGEATNSPYVLDWIGAPVGLHELVAVGTDDRGASNASIAVEVSVVQQLPSPNLQISLIQTGSVWKYFDTGVDQGMTWVSANFDDSLWPAGPGELGYGDAAEATVIGFGPDAENKFPTYYFRHAFVATNAAALAALRLRLLRDDAAIVYLNGIEVFRDNLPSGPIGFTNLALVEIGKEGETTFLETDVPLAPLANGTNILAVEIHQVSPADADVSFDLELIGIQPAAPVIVGQPENQMVARGHTAQFQVQVAGIEPLFYQWFFNGLIALPAATNATLLVTNAQPSSEGSYSVEVSNSVAVVRSSSAILTVLDTPRILVQPQNTTVLPGGAAEFSIIATGMEPLRYQWLFNETNILAGATNRTLRLLGVSTAESGSYAVVVSNPVGSVTSQPALLRVLLPSQVVRFTRTATLVTLSFSTASNLRYTVEFTADFNLWTLLPGAVKLFGTGDVLTVVDGTVAVPQRFYRIRVE